MVARRRLGSRIALAGISTLIGLTFSAVAGELALRTIRPLDLGTSIEHRLPHPVRGWMLEPGASYVNQVGPVRVPVAYTSAGWRDVEHPMPKHADEARVLILGDSFMEGYSVEIEELLSRRLEKWLADRRPRTRVVNLGVGGYGTLQQLLTFREAGIPHVPALVLLGFYENDLQNNLFDLEIEANHGDALKVSARPFLDETPGWQVSRPDYESAKLRLDAARLRRENYFWPRLLRRSALLQQLARTEQWFEAKWDYAAAIGRAGFARLGGFVSAEAERESLSKRAAERAGCTDLYERAWAITERILQRLRQEVEVEGAELIVFSVPSVGVTAIDRVQNSASQTLGRCAGEKVMKSRLVEVTERLGITFFDLFPHFNRATHDDSSTLFHLADNHWNAEGHRVAAEALTDIVRSTLDRQTAMSTRPKQGAVDGSGTTQIWSGDAP